MCYKNVIFNRRVPTRMNLKQQQNIAGKNEQVNKNEV